MESVHLGADAENLTGAVRIYERLGFRVRKTIVVYRKLMEMAYRPRTEQVTSCWCTARAREPRGGSPRA
jgi:ribosomal protein S18 acetylase RimI-like enzyme